MMMDAEQRQNELMAEQAAVLGRWLWILFWLVVPANIAGIMKNERMLSFSADVYLIGQIASAVCAVAYGAILLKLSSVEEGYRIAGICSLITSAISILVVIIYGSAKAPTASLVITGPALIVALIREYNEYNAHSSVLRGVDDELSGKWTELWKWFIRCMVGLLGSILFLAIAYAVGVVILIGTIIGMLIVGVVKLVYMYRTAKVFREYPATAVRMEDAE